MEDIKAAIVLDTNAIIELGKDLDSFVKDQQQNYNVFVPQVVIDERKAQMELDIISKFEKLESARKELSSIASIESKTSKEDLTKRIKEKSQISYERLFGERIIPLNSSSSLFSRVLERTYLKRPPYSNAPNASDKGFKDSLIWLCLIDFFSSRPEQEVIFITSDDAFNKRYDELRQEFEECTGKRLIVKDLKSFVSPPSDTGTPLSEPNPQSPIDFDLLRSRVQTVASSIAGIYDNDYWGNVSWDPYFSIALKANGEYVAEVISRLSSILDAHIFDENIDLMEVLDFDGRVVRAASIERYKLQNLDALNAEILATAPNYLPQFYSAVASIFNKNYTDQYDFSNIQSADIPF